MLTVFIIALFPTAIMSLLGFILPDVSIFPSILLSVLESGLTFFFGILWKFDFLFNAEIVILIVSTTIVFYTLTYSVKLFLWIVNKLPSWLVGR